MPVQPPRWALPLATLALLAGCAGDAATLEPITETFAHTLEPLAPFIVGFETEVDALLTFEVRSTGAGDLGVYLLEAGQDSRDFLRGDGFAYFVPYAYHESIARDTIRLNPGAYNLGVRCESEEDACAFQGTYTLEASE